MLPIVRPADGIVGLIAVAVTVIACAAWKGSLNGVPVVALLFVGYQVAMSARTAPRAPTSLLERLQADMTPAAVMPSEVPRGQQLRGAVIYFGMLALYSGVIELVDPSIT